MLIMTFPLYDFLILFISSASFFRFIPSTCAISVKEKPESPLVLANFINCQTLNQGDKIEYYINYTLTPPKSTQTFIYYFEPNFEVGT